MGWFIETESLRAEREREEEERRYHNDPWYRHQIDLKAHLNGHGPAPAPLRHGKECGCPYCYNDRRFGGKLR